MLKQVIQHLDSLPPSSTTIDVVGTVARAVHLVDSDAISHRLDIINIRPRTADLLCTFPTLYTCSETPIHQGICNHEHCKRNLQVQ